MTVLNYVRLLGDPGVDGPDKRATASSMHPTGEASATRVGLVAYHGPMNLSFPQRTRVDAIIQAAMDMEAAPLLHALAPIGDDETPHAVLAGTHKTQRFALGILDGKTVLVVTSGIGLANAASATARALTLVDAPIVIDVYKRQTPTRMRTPPWSRP